jgi:hypothetical protein
MNIASFYSTALLTMQKIYNIKATGFYFDYSKSYYKDAIDKVYEYYKDKIKIIDLDEFKKSRL